MSYLPFSLATRGISGRCLTCEPPPERDGDDPQHTARSRAEASLDVRRVGIRLSARDARRTDRVQSDGQRTGTEYDLLQGDADRVRFVFCRTGISLLVRRTPNRRTRSGLKSATEQSSLVMSLGDWWATFRLLLFIDILSALFLYVLDPELVTSAAGLLSGEDIVSSRLGLIFRLAPNGLKGIRSGLFGREGRLNGDATVGRADDVARPAAPFPDHRMSAEKWMCLVPCSQLMEGRVGTREPRTIAGFPSSTR